MTKPISYHKNAGSKHTLIRMRNTISRAPIIALTVALFLSSSIACADTITETRIVKNKDLPGVHKIDFMSFDANHDGRLSMREVGDVLFDAFDSDKNGAIDNIEYDRNNVYTVIPMEATTLTFVDFDDDGYSDASTISKEDFLKRSNLMRFDKDMDGLSPRDFMGSEVKAMDLNHNNLIEKDEWQRQYALNVKPESSIGKLYNR